MNISAFAFMGFHSGFDVIVFAVLLLVLAFEIAMFIDVIQNNRISSNARLWWIIGMVLIHPIVAIAYYFTDRTKSL